MNNDIRPPKRPSYRGDQSGQLPSPNTQPIKESVTSTIGQPPEQPSEGSLPRPIDQDVPTSKSNTNPAIRRSRRLWLWAISAVIAVVLLSIAATAIWYVQAQRPVQSGVAEKVNVTIEPGTTPDQIAAQLKEAKLIRSELAFAVHTRIKGVRGQLQAGDYRLAPTETLGQIVTQLQAGQSAQFSVTFYPGATLYDPTDIEDAKRTDVYTMLTRAGYSDQEVRNGLEAEYDHPLLAGKPANASLEGYIYGDTYQFQAGASVEDILMRTFDEFYAQITERNLVQQLQAQDLTLYEGITLASIIEREVSGRDEDQRQVSQIFHLRLDEGITLGADATFMYAAQQANQTPTINFDSAYNTRLNRGLPPGPIAAPHISALEAAADPADGDFLYFVSGDDGTTHFARTEAEHERNTREYCTDLCYSIE